MRTFFQKLFSPYPLPKMMSLLDATPHLQCLFVYVIQGQPGGSKAEYWISCETKDVIKAWQVVSKGKIDRDNRQIAFEEQLNIQCRIEYLRELLNNLGFWSMRDDLGNARDGIHYTIAYADHQRARLVRIWNPVKSTKSEVLTSAIEKYLMQCGLLL